MKLCSFLNKEQSKSVLEFKRNGLEAFSFKASINDRATTCLFISRTVLRQMFNTFNYLSTAVCLMQATLWGKPLTIWPITYLHKP